MTTAFYVFGGKCFLEVGLRDPKRSYGVPAIVCPFREPDAQIFVLDRLGGL